MISVENLDMKVMSGSLRLGKSTLDNGYGISVPCWPISRQGGTHPGTGGETLPIQPVMQLLRIQKPGHEGSFHPEDPLPEMRHGI